LYGLDTAIEAFKILAMERSALRLALFIAKAPRGKKAKQYLSNLEARLEHANLSGRLLIAFSLPLVPAFRHAVVVVRPTRTEGDALSVREALHAAVPVVASDVAERPSGTLTFPVGDVARLCDALRRALATEIPGRGPELQGIDESRAEPFLDRLMHIYHAELSHR
jgi:glycosyltransferase involved in cell wall biosynthesis